MLVCILIIKIGFFIPTVWLLLPELCSLSAVVPPDSHVIRIKLDYNWKLGGRRWTQIMSRCKGNEEELF